jgi:hypothetical protein
MPQVPQVRRLGEVFGLCSDAIELAPRACRQRTAPHLARADRRPGEPVPGRDRAGRVVSRTTDGVAVGDDEA